MIFKETILSGSYTIDLEPRTDERGFFARYFCEKEFAKKGLNAKWVQINNSMSNDIGTLRGLHFQYPPHSEVKLVRCIKGAIWDVIVDIRVGSESFGKWFGAELNESNRKMLYVPKGFAHGFITLAPQSEIIYLVSDFYSKDHEQSLLWSDESIGISWPLAPSVISEKDADAPRLNALKPFVLSNY